ncbi:diguanylate cyclase domain-containing protein [Serpentinicella alkaliphila]|uniref:Stage 0 sporulation protein A homolog n=1 Tax=Serpentinicella alkaliphila TaxID=1734049 RepID=A0A4R2TEV0_9FIRM|nr:diguanylate cyclase [Serpentinicella alkaliphila]QUH25402.1 diguanylate cyclase [Serpentinicella alkaliphila]TCQ00607.1 response regulator receiver modulated diguanylate cyclase [Serpentinicella alkaliphila]
MKDKDINILVVDDRLENILVLEGVLEDLDCNIISATSGNEALGMMLEYDFALVLMDVQMPNMDGFETAEIMRSSKRTRHIPIIFVTAIYKEQRYLFKGYEIGAVDYLFKPIETVVLKSKVSVFIELFRQTIQLRNQTEQLEKKLIEIMELQDANEKLLSLSNHDGLTGVANRRSFDQHIRLCWRDSISNKYPISVIMIDIDCFKVFNDNYGHIKGDECLIAVANKIASSVKRSSDFVARYGGEEFVVILSNTDVYNAEKLAERIRNNIVELFIPHEYSTVIPYITISLGVATIIPEKNDRIEMFLSQADMALYEAKLLGRNRVIVYKKEKELNNVENGTISKACSSN